MAGLAGPLKNPLGRLLVSKKNLDFFYPDDFDTFLLVRKSDLAFILGNFYPGCGYGIYWDFVLEYSRSILKLIFKLLLLLIFRLFFVF